MNSHSIHKIIFFGCALAIFWGQALNATTIRCGQIFDVDGSPLRARGSEITVRSGLPYERAIDHPKVGYQKFTELLLKTSLRRRAS